MKRKFLLMKLFVLLLATVIFILILANGFFFQKSIKLSPLFGSIASGDFQKANKLMASGVDVNMKDHDGLTPLHYAIIYNQYNIAKKLIDYGADPSIHVMQNRNLLNYAAMLEQVDPRILKLLVNVGVDPNFKISYYDLTPLSETIIRRNFPTTPRYEEIEILVSMGADPYAQLSNGKNSFDLAKDQNDDRLVEILNGLRRNE